MEIHKRYQTRGRPRTQIRPKSREAIEDLLSRIADKRPENIVSQALNVSTVAVRQWVRRGIPQAHWPTIASLAGVPLATVAAAHDLNSLSSPP